MKDYETHGHTKGRKRSPTYQCWQNIVSRCTNTAREDYKYYGGRGIKVCERWRSSFLNFLEDMGEKPGPGLSIDRQDNAKGYAPENCRWATKDQQMQNTRGTAVIEFRGIKLGLAAWARKLGINRQSLRDRITRGWPLARALTQAPRHKNQVA